MLTEQLYRNIIDNLCDGMYFVDLERKISLWNKAAEKITGYKKEEVLGHCCHNNILCHIDKKGNQLCLLGCPLHSTMEDGVHREDEVFLRHKDGHRIPVAAKIFPIYNEDNKIIGAVEIFTSNSPKVYQDDLVTSLTKMVMTDQLTGLSNRRYGETYLESKFKEFKRFGAKFCVTFLDLDNFSMCNNDYGHEAGDAVLCGIANTFRHNFREADMLCRWGGEEFVGIFEAQNDYEVWAIAEKLRVLVENSEANHEGQVIKVTTSIGATLAKPDDTLESLINRADSLMYESKQKGKNFVTIG